jgi:hypothetical protein
MYSESDMAKKEHDRFADLAADIGSPRVLPNIDRALVENQRERIELLELRKMAVRRHGELAPSPASPSPQAIEAPLPKPEIHGFDGTLRSLANLYCTSSSFLNLRYKTRKHYEVLVKFIVDEWGDKKIADWKLQDIERLYEGWVRTRTESMGRSLIVMLRIIIYFGADTLHISECEHLSVVLHRMRFPVLKARSERITSEQVVRIRGAAHSIGRPSIALAQAFQSDCNLRQTDCIGEWVPTNEPGESELFDAGNKWIRGLRWDEIDENLILRHTMSRSQTEIVVDLNDAPMVLKELELKFGSIARNKMPASGPIIVAETSGFPWYAVEFRRNWRLAADKAGVPRTVKNRDSRPSSKPERDDGDLEEDVDISLELGERSSLTH